MAPVAWGLELLRLKAAIMDAKEALDYFRLKRDKLKIDLCEAALNDLLERYSCYVCQMSEMETPDGPSSGGRTARSGTSR